MKPGLKMFLFPYGPTALVVTTVMGLVVHNIVDSIEDTPATVAFETPKQGNELPPQALPALPGTRAPSVPKQPVPPGVPQKRAGKPVVDFTKFVTLKYRSFEVVTGIGFKHPDNPPTNQWCYAIITQDRSNAARKVTLATKLGPLPVAFKDVTDTEAKPFAMTGTGLEGLARTHCRFVDGNTAPFTPKQRG